MPDVNQLYNDYIDKYTKYINVTKNRAREVTALDLSTDFRDKFLEFSNAGGFETSSYDTILNKPYKGYPFKMGVKLDLTDKKKQGIVVAGGGDNLYGFCHDLHEYGGIAQIIPISGNTIHDIIVCKKENYQQINPNDYLFFNDKGELEKTANAKQINCVALSKAFKIHEDLFVVIARITGYRPK